MSKYYDAMETWNEWGGGTLDETSEELLSLLEKLVNNAYQDGYKACLRANLFKEDSYEQEK